MQMTPKARASIASAARTNGYVREEVLAISSNRRICLPRVDSVWFSHMTIT